MAVAVAVAVVVVVVVVVVAEGAVEGVLAADLQVVEAAAVAMVMDCLPTGWEYVATVVVVVVVVVFV